ncbi:AraC family transcriptional regulator [Pseudoduganella sp. OTU4001]|uniref:AraC family transcriptional regulator n=1 Tax=Pseudoduganella sp. OTU4001 TaxID=3043854 RepID=UPI00313EF8B5
MAPPPIVLIRARALTGFRTLVAQLRGDATTLLADNGIDEKLLDEPEATISLPAMGRLLNDAAKRLQAPDFGLQLAAMRDFSILGAVALIARHSATVGDAMRAVARNIPYHSSGQHMAIADDPLRPGYTRVTYTLNTGDDTPQRQLVELGLCMTQHFLQRFAGQSGADFHITFRHPAPVSKARYARHFAGELRFEQEANTISVPSRLLAMPMAEGSSAPLQAAAERWVNNVIRRYPLDIAQQVEALLARQFATGAGTLVQIASQLGLHERTLQRRLKEQGVFFEDILDRLRRNRAQEYLAYQAFPLSQVASLLGYTEPSSFNRACKRWFGKTPLAYRNSQRPI